MSDEPHFVPTSILHCLIVPYFVFEERKSGVAMQFVKTPGLLVERHDMGLQTLPKKKKRRMLRLNNLFGCIVI